MRLPDVNILVAAHRAELPVHAAMRAWLEAAASGPEPLAISDHVLASFLRIVTHPGIFRPASPFATALEFVQGVRAAESAVRVAPGPRHWEIFVELCTNVEARGNLIPDAWLAALAMESGSEFVTTDRDYARFPGLRWSHPLRR